MLIETQFHFQSQCGFANYSHIIYLVQGQFKLIYDGFGSRKCRFYFIISRLYILKEIYSFSLFLTHWVSLNDQIVYHFCHVFICIIYWFFHILEYTIYLISFLNTLRRVIINGGFKINTISTILVKRKFIWWTFYQIIQQIYFIIYSHMICDFSFLNWFIRILFLNQIILNVFRLIFLYEIFILR